MDKKDNSIVFVHALGKTTLSADVKNWSYEQLEQTYKGVLDYISLAKQLGISPKAAPKKDVSKDSEPK